MKMTRRLGGSLGSSHWLIGLLHMRALCQPCRTRFLPETGSPCCANEAGVFHMRKRAISHGMLSPDFGRRQMCALPHIDRGLRSDLEEFLDHFKTEMAFAARKDSPPDRVEEPALGKTHQSGWNHSGKRQRRLRDMGGMSLGEPPPSTHREQAWCQNCGSPNRALRTALSVGIRFTAQDRERAVELLRQHHARQAMREGHLRK
jgi:hypothetical protein